MKTYDFIHSDTQEPHVERRRQILAKYPEVKKLFGHTPSTALWTVGVVLLQIVMAVAVSHSPWWVILATAYIIGATADHAMFVVIHDCTHNLAFKSTNGNRWLGMFANLPVVFPSAMGFRKYHLLHHRHQGDMDFDADLAGPKEAALVGNSSLLKTLWLLFFFFVEGIIRPARLKNVQLMDRWVATNVVVELAFLAVLFYFTNVNAIIYLTLSTLFSIGLHPLGARWIQEHYVVKPGQETYSYYGPFNKVMFNVGYHNEHHDLMMVPWSRLPQLRKMAPEFYDTLHYHTSYWSLLTQFIFDRNLSLYSRVIRPGRANMGASSEASSARFATSPEVAT